MFCFSLKIFIQIYFLEMSMGVLQKKEWGFPLVGQVRAVALKSIVAHFYSNCKPFF